MCVTTRDKQSSKAENTTSIGKEDANLFTDLLRKMFDHDRTKCITARQVLDYPWLQETGQKPYGSGVQIVSAQNLQTNQTKDKSQQSAQQPAPKPKPQAQNSSLKSKTQAQHYPQQVQTARPIVDVRLSGAQDQKEAGWSK